MHTAIGEKNPEKLVFFFKPLYKLIFFCQIWKDLVLWNALAINQQVMKIADIWN